MVRFLYIINTLDTVYSVYMLIYKPLETHSNLALCVQLLYGFLGFINMHINLVNSI